MIEVHLQDSDKTMVYVTADESRTVDQLFRIKDSAAVYYKKGQKIAYHWFLNPITVGNLQLTNK